MIPPVYQTLAELAHLRFHLTDEEKHYFDYYFAEKFGYPYGHEPQPLPPHLQDLFPKHKQPVWLDEWYTEYQVQDELLTMLSTPQIQNTIVFLSRVPTQGVQEANELVSLVQFYQSLLPENAPTEKGSTVPVSDTESVAATAE
jgi:hypothetical protein